MHVVVVYAWHDITHHSGTVCAYSCVIPSIFCDLIVLLLYIYPRCIINTRHCCRMHR